jgi:hypothetical protein
MGTSNTARFAANLLKRQRFSFVENISASGMNKFLLKKTRG